MAAGGSIRQMLLLVLLSLSSTTNGEAFIPKPIYHLPRSECVLYLLIIWSRDATGKFDKASERVRFRALLTIDGGGIRGIIAVKVLERVENAIKEVEMNSEGGRGRDQSDVHLADYFSCFSGINSGAWIAAYLASKCGNFRCSEVLETREVVDRYGTIKPGSVDGLKVLFELFSSKIYPPMESRSFWRPVATMLRRRCPLGTCPTYPIDGYRRVFSAFIGNTVMINLPASLILPMYDIKKRSVVTIAFDSFEPKANQSVFTYIFRELSRATDPVVLEEGLRGFEEYKNRSFSLLDATLAAGTSPMKQQAHRFRAINEESFELVCTDAAMLNSNPTLVSLALMGRLRAEKGSDSSRMAITDVSVLSIGTGIVDGSLAKQADSGILQWSILSDDFMSTVTHGGSELIQNQVDAFAYGAVGKDPEWSHYRTGQYLRVQARASDGTPYGEALMASEDMTYFELLKQIGDATSASFKKSIADFVRAYVCQVEDSSHRDMTDTVLMNGWEELLSMAEQLEEQSGDAER